jgi:hypothetical protein
VVLRGSPKPVPDNPKTAGKRSGKGLKSSATKVVGETTPETASSKLIKQFFLCQHLGAIHFGKMTAMHSLRSTEACTDHAIASVRKRSTTST